MNTLLEHFRGRQENIIRLMQQIIEIESPSRDASGSTAVAEWLESQLPKVPSITGIERIKVEGLGEHVILRVFESDAKPALILGHTDTVHPRGGRQRTGSRLSGSTARPAFPGWSEADPGRVLNLPRSSPGPLRAR